MPVILHEGDFNRWLDREEAKPVVMVLARGNDFLWKGGQKQVISETIETFEV
jgi:hypothetical protein